MKILIMGLSGSGKTFLSKLLQKELSCAWYNADNLREMANDWDFSEEGRRRQSFRMKVLADYEKQNESTSLDGLVDNYKPPIFWKDKPIVKKQLENWSIPRIKDLIININKTETFLKKNSSISLMLVFNFIYETSGRS